MTTMSALALRDGQVVHEPAHALPPESEGDALVRVTLAGICGTDLELLRGYAGFAGIPGHEFVGVVEACPDVEWVGRRVVGEISAGCGACGACARLGGGHCPTRRVLGIRGHGGAFAEYLRLPATLLHAVPDDVPDERAVFTEPLAAACRVLDQVPAAAGIRAAVVGDGRLGLLCAQVLADAGATVSVVGRHPEKLALAAGWGCGIEAASGQDVVVEASGTPDGFAAARALLRPRGTLVLKSTCAGGRAAVDLAALVVDEIHVVGSRCGPFSEALRLLAEQRIDVDSLVSATYPLRDGPRAFDHAASALKVLLRPGAA